MNDLQTLHAALTGDEPSQDVVDRSRHRLQNRINGGRRAFPKRTAWLAVGTGLTVAVAAAAVAISVVPSGSSPDTSTSSQATTKTKTVTGQEILLAAATAAEQAPDSSGTYWHLKVTYQRGGHTEDGYETWTKPNGETWSRSAKSGGKVVSLALVNSHPFDLFGAGMTLEQLRALPTDPAALQAWIAEAITNGAGRTSAGPLKDVPELFEQAKFDSLVSLVSTLPAPPEVRAAAFRALAAYPGVKNLGPVSGGQALELPSGKRFVVDPATGQLTGTSTYVLDGGTVTMADGDSATITGEWTDTLPS